MTGEPQEPAAASNQPDDEALAAFIGPSWKYYQTALKTRPFNIAAAIAPFWLAWRGFVGTQALAMLAFFFLWIVAVGLVDRWALSDTAGIWLSFGVPYLLLGLLEGASANQLLRHKARAAWNRTRARNLERDAALKAMRKAGGISVANVIVMPLLVLLIGYSFYLKAFGGHNHGKPYLASMKSDLRNLVTAEESYFADNVTYTTSLENLNFEPYSAGVTIRIGAASGTGWNATATHNGLPNTMCGIYIGSGSSPVEGAIAGEPMCQRHEH